MSNVLTKITTLALTIFMFIPYATASSFYDGVIVSNKDLYDEPVYSEVFEKTVACLSTSDYKACMRNKIVKVVNVIPNQIISGQTLVMQECLKKFESNYCDCFISSMFEVPDDSLKRQFQSTEMIAKTAASVRAVCHMQIERIHFKD